MHSAKTTSSTLPTRKLIFWSITASLAGFLFGFDTVVISGAEKAIASLWGLTPWVHGAAISSALWGTVVGSLVGGWPTDRFGRKTTLVWIGFLYLLSALWSGLATDVWSFMIARFLGGLGVGISTVAAPLFISEIAPPGNRGRLAGMFQFNIVFGILIAFLSNFLMGVLIEESAWRWMLGIEAIPALVYMLMCFALPQSPRWLIVNRGQVEQARDVLGLLNPELDSENVDKLVEQIRNSAGRAERPTRDPFWSLRLRIPIMLAFLVAFFNQMSGINAILYFAPRIFGMAGMGESAALLNSVGIGVVNLAFTFVGLYLIDRRGRKSLLYLGSIGYIISLGVCAMTFFTYATPFSAATASMDAKDAITNLEQVSAAEGLDAAYLEEARQERDTAAERLQQAAQSMEIPVTESTDDQAIRRQADAVAEAAEKRIGVGSILVFVSILAFIAAHAVGQGAVIWVLISEVFPNRHRAMGQALGSFTHWIFAALIAMLFPVMIVSFAPGYLFLFFTIMMVLQLLWVIFLVPETRGVPLEELEMQLLR